MDFAATLAVMMSEVTAAGILPIAPKGFKLNGCIGCGPREVEQIINALKVKTILD
jgi:hypothetical protein